MILRQTSVALGILLLALTNFVSAKASTPSSQELVNQLEERWPGVKVYRLGHRLSRIWGVPLGAGDSPVLAAESFVRQFGSIFSPGRSEFQIERITDLLSGKFTAVQFRQVAKGLPVDRGSLVLLVRNRSNEIVLASSQVRTIDRVPDRPRVSAARAMQAAQLDSPWVLRFGNPRLVLWESEEEERIAWCFHAENGLASMPSAHLVFVDAVTANVLEWRNLVREINIYGNVTGFATPGLKPDQPNNPPLEIALSDLRVAVAGGDYAFTNSDGSYTILHGGSDPVNVTAELKGKWVSVTNGGGSNLVLSQTITPPGPANFIFNSPPAEFGTAQVNGFVHTERAHDFAKQLNPNYPGIDIALPAYVNLNNTCRAYYTGSSIAFYRAGNGCANTAYSTIIYHEYGHFIVHKGHATAAGDYHEGMADVTAALIADSPCLGEDFLGQGAGCGRNAYNNVRYPCSGEVHLCGQVLSGAFWLTLDRLDLSEGHETALDLVRQWYINSILLLPSGITPEITIDVLTLDDDDGNISNGTPHYGEIASGFGAKGLDAPDLHWVVLEPLRLAPEFLQLPSASARIPITMRISSGSGILNPLAVRLVMRTNQDDWVETPMIQLSPGVFGTSLPVPPPGSSIQYYVKAQDTYGRGNTYPKRGPSDPLFTVSGTSITLSFEDTFDADTGWSIESTNPVDGEWTRADPNGTTEFGQSANPEDDSEDVGTFCLFTGLGSPGGPPGAADVDGGPTRATSPRIDLSNANAIIEYERWLWNDAGDDYFSVEVSNDDGATWRLIERVAFATGFNTWIRRKFVVSAYVVPTMQTRVRFSISDDPNNSVTEAGVDWFRVRRISRP
ncbi:MAG: hypothetical protein AKCLJLPJ_00914 [Fimbriimonadales bacterium]|nr:hypothetical protein [Fimbriimonadales bacterium]